MFGLFKKKTPSDNVIAFCERADDALMLAYEQGDIHAIVPYFTHPLIDYILEEIQSGADLITEYGISKYRIRTWDNKQSINEAALSISKHIRHENVSIRGMIDIPVGDPIDEDWVVITQGNQMFVKDIRRRT